MSKIKACRSLLFAPADDVDRLDAAFRSSAEGVVADLEDGVPQSRKDVAREILAAFLTEAPPRRPLLVRINSPETVHAARDLEVVATLRPEGIVVPKATPEAIASVGMLGVPMVAVVETAGGLRLAYEIASSRGVVALALGANDLASALGLEGREDGLELLYARSKLVADSAAAGLRGPFDRVYPFDDPVGLADDAGLARSLGFGGKSALRPDQCGIINDVFAPPARASGVAAIDRTAASP